MLCQRHVDAMVDAEMKDVETNDGSGGAEKVQKEDKGDEAGKKTPLQLMHANLKLLSKAVATKENRTINRVLRQIFAMRKSFTVDMAEKLSNAIVSDVEARDLLLKLLQKVRAMLCPGADLDRPTRRERMQC